jgi:hypothetical protein
MYLHASCNKPLIKELVGVLYLLWYPLTYCQMCTSECMFEWMNELLIIICSDLKGKIPSSNWKCISVIARKVWYKTLGKQIIHLSCVSLIANCECLLPHVWLSAPKNFDVNSRIVLKFNIWIIIQNIKFDKLI